MRVIAGKYRGKKLALPNENYTRPTIDRVKEAMFSILTPYLPNSDCLDLFSGSGALGIECISRGAKSVVFNDIEPSAIKVIKTNLLGISEDYKIYKSDYLSLINSLDTKFDVILLDPPFAKIDLSFLIKKIKDNNLLNDHGVIMVETNKKDSFNFDDDFESKEYCYGSVKLTLLKVKN